MTDWERIVNDHGRAIFTLGWRILGNALDTEALVQDVFLEAHALFQMRPVGPWRFCLLHLTANWALARLARKRNPAPVFAGVRSHADRFRQGITRLAQRDAVIVLLRVFAELTVTEIGDGLRVEPHIVQVSLARSRSRLEDLLPEGVAALA